MYHNIPSGVFRLDFLDLYQCPRILLALVETHLTLK